MIYFFFTILLILSNSLFTGDLFAQSQPNIAITSLSQGERLQIEIEPSANAQNAVGINCSYTVYAARKRRRITGNNPNLNTAILIDQVIPKTGATFLITDLQRLRRRDTTRRRFHFRALEDCGGSLLFSTIRRRLFPTRESNSLTNRAWREQLKEELPFSHLTVRNAFPNINLTQITDIRHANDGSDRLFLVQQTGIISVITNDSNTSTIDTFLDITDLTTASGERGLYSIAFHPNFANNNYIYVHYTGINSGDTTVSRFTVDASNPNSVDPSTALTIFSAPQPFPIHNGGSILFGPDNFLYIMYGDGGEQGDPNSLAQNRSNPYGSILRLDINNPSNGENYGIPSSNPYAGNTSGFLEEIYAYGLRNPWRASFDRFSGELWIGDVGFRTFEEINRVNLGDNLGWPILEGESCRTPGCDTNGLTLPLHAYGRRLGASVTGGYVYRGSVTPSLFGSYIFGDFTAGNLFLYKEESINASPFRRFISTESFISTFGEDEAGELYFADYGGGSIFQIIPR